MHPSSMMTPGRRILFAPSLPHLQDVAIGMFEHPEVTLCSHSDSIEKRGFYRLNTQTLAELPTRFLRDATP